MKKYLNINRVILLALGILFFIGIILILKSDSWALGGSLSMNLAGAIISIFSGLGLLSLYKKVG